MHSKLPEARVALKTRSPLNILPHQAGEEACIENILLLVQMSRPEADSAPNKKPNIEHSATCPSKLPERRKIERESYEQLTSKGLRRMRTLEMRLHMP